MASESLSSAEVASSRSNTLGFLTKARAIATLCFCPPDNWLPRSPTSVSYPSGNVMIKSCAFAIIAAFSISACVASGKPYAIFFPIVVLNRVGSCPTRPI
mmetsp:Transcript_8488/g.15386  ORF Transcript_8488/g.15386 Transcript_8488/m.15386 type:complete len:100 (-) Transcript_8488:948-1247(-)